MLCQCIKYSCFVLVARNLLITSDAKANDSGNVNNDRLGMCALQASRPFLAPDKYVLARYLFIV